MKKLGFGLMRLPLLDEKDNTSIDLEKTKKLFDAFLASGFTYFDTAYVYHGGNSEKVFGNLVADRYPRDAFSLTDKMPMFVVKTAEDYPRIFAEQLERCHVSYFDYYFLHALTDDRYPLVSETDGFGFLRQLKEEGKIKHIGFSFHGSPAMLETILSEHPEVELVQLQINYVDWENPNVNARECYEIARRHGKEIAVMEPIKGGLLAHIPAAAEEKMKQAAPDAGIASWALRYAASLDGVMIVLSGMNTDEQLNENMSLFDSFKPLDETESKLIAECVEIINHTVAIPCTGCHYCTDGCPMSIAIPDLFKLWNRTAVYGKVNDHVRRFGQITAENGKPSDCIRCGQCESVCPQGLPIIDTLAEIAKEYEN